jgi:hypothetical protein
MKVGAMVGCSAVEKDEKMAEKKGNLTVDTKVDKRVERKAERLEI